MQLVLLHSIWTWSRLRFGIDLRVQNTKNSDDEVLDLCHLFPLMSQCVSCFQTFIPVDWMRSHFDFIPIQLLEHSVSYGWEQWREKKITFSTSTDLLTADFIRRIHHTLINLTHPVWDAHQMTAINEGGADLTHSEVVRPLSWYWELVSSSLGPPSKKMSGVTRFLQLVPGRPQLM